MDQAGNAPPEIRFDRDDIPTIPLCYIGLLQAICVLRISQDVVQFVGATNSGDGSPDDPYQDIEEALQHAPNGATLIFKAGTGNTFSSASLVLDRPLTLKGYNVTIQKQ